MSGRRRAIGLKLSKCGTRSNLGYDTLNKDKTQVTTYSPARKAVHWGVLFLCIAQFPTGWAIASSHLGHVGLTQSPWSVFVHRSHALAGTAVVLLVVAGVLLGLMQGTVPPAKETAPRWMRRAAIIAHAFMCGLLLALSLTGFVAMYMSRSAAPVHVVLTYLGLALTGLHVLGALWHQFVLGDGTITRMLPRLGSSTR